MSKTFLGYTWVFPHILTRRIRYSATIIENAIATLRMLRLPASVVEQIRVDLEINIKNIEDSIAQRNINFWRIKSMAYKSFYDQVDEIQESFETARLMWIANQLLNLGYLNHLDTISTSVMMLEAIYPDVRPAAAAIAAQKCTEQAMTVIQLQHQTTLEIQNQFASAMGFTDLDNMTKVTFAEVQKQLKAAKQIQK